MSNKELNETDVKFSSNEIINPNEEIIKGYEQHQIIKEWLKDINEEIKERYNDDEDISLLSHKIEELNIKLKPLKEELKTRQEEFRTNNMQLFETKKNLMNQRERVNNNILRAVAKKQENKDDSPILIGEWKRQKRLIVNLKPTLKKAKIED